MALEKKITYFAETDHRGRKKKFGIKEDDRMKHTYIIGKTGMGKSTLLENMAAQDIQNGNGMAFIDPHGSAAETLLSYIPEDRANDVIYFAPFDMEYPISFNIMEDVGYDKRHLVVSGLMSAFRKIWKDTWSARMEYILQNTLLALLEYPDSTILGVNRMLIDKEFRKKVVERITDPVVKSFWVDEFAKYTDRYTQEATPAIQNKIGQFVSNPLIRNIVGQTKSSFDFRKAMDEKKILIMNLSKGRMGDTNAQLIGSMLIIKIYLAAMSRADMAPALQRTLPPFYFFVDEFQAFANETFADILSESRKYNLSLTIAHQYIEQMPEEVRDAVFGNVGTMIVFRVGAYDAEVLEKEFAPVFYQEDIVNLGFAQIYLRLMIDGIASKPFSATTLPPLPLLEPSYAETIIENSRASYAKKRADVEHAITEWHQPIAPPEKKEEWRKENQNQRNEKVRAPQGAYMGVSRRADGQRQDISPSPRGDGGSVREGVVPRPHVSLPDTLRRAPEAARRSPIPEGRGRNHEPPAGHASFKDAFKKEQVFPRAVLRPAAQTEAKEPKKILTPHELEAIRRSKKEGGGTDNKNALKEALAAALKSEETKQEDGNRRGEKNEFSQKEQNRSPQSGERPTENNEHSSAADSAQRSAKSETQNHIPEIPEDDLREMLRVEKERE